MPRKIKASYLIEPDQREKYSCPECEYILSDAVQISCGHLLCCDCAEDLKTKCSPCCPRLDCGEELKTQEFFSDRCVRRVINTLPLVCQCDWKGSVGEFCDDHREKCPFAECSTIIEAESPLLKSQVGACQETSQASTVQCTGLGIMRASSPAGSVQCPNFGIPTATPFGRFYPIFEEKPGFPDHKVSGMIGMGEGEAEADSEVKAGAGAQARRSQGSLVKEMQKMEAEMAKRDELVQTLQDKVVHLECRVANMERNPSNVSFTMSIPDVYKQIEDARAEKCISIDLSPFYFNPNGSGNNCGYKMCLRLFMNGDGIGKGTHMSLFFVIMKGEFDNILQWPFTHKVTFKLINKRSGRDVVESIHPNPFSSSFQQPKSDINVASECPRFVSINELLQEGFIIDDTIFIEIKVDTSDGVNQAL